ncbi:DUF6461 domain-containing protein [Streptomyces sp. NPDC001415]
MTASAADYVWINERFPDLAEAPVGYLGVTKERALPASAATRWVSHFINMNGLASFLWAEVTTERVTFEPAVSDRRWGTAPDELLEASITAASHSGTRPPTPQNTWPQRQHSSSPST